MVGLNHEWHTCKRERCCICDGGLGLCTVCGAAEGELLTYCPGFRLNNEALEACYTGNVIDMESQRSRLRKGNIK
jgi:hypothetical protein